MTAEYLCRDCQDHFTVDTTENVRCAHCGGDDVSVQVVVPDVDDYVDEAWDARTRELERWRLILRTVIDDTIGNLLDDGEEGGCIRDDDGRTLTAEDLLSHVSAYVDSMVEVGLKADIDTLEAEMGN